MKHMDELEKYEDSLRLRYDELKEELRQSDLSEQDVLHYIENERYDATCGAKLLKRLREIRNQRRDIKNEQSEIQSIIRWMEGYKDIKVPNYSTKIYTFRTKILKDIDERDSIGGLNE